MHLAAILARLRVLQLLGIHLCPLLHQVAPYVPPVQPHAKRRRDCREGDGPSDPSTSRSNAVGIEALEVDLQSASNVPCEVVLPQEVPVAAKENKEHSKQRRKHDEDSPNDLGSKVVVLTHPDPGLERTRQLERSGEEEHGALNHSELEGQAGQDRPISEQTLALRFRFFHRLARSSKEPEEVVVQPLADASEDHHEGGCGDENAGTLALGNAHQEPDGRGHERGAPREDLVEYHGGILQNRHHPWKNVNDAVGLDDCDQPVRDHLRAQDQHIKRELQEENHADKTSAEKGIEQLLARGAAVILVERRG
mmetsp:Transcript_71419/g.180261  ORF Transcript_71419/g.180261 Transcript_71419/m.180261 type:complete len:309 (+) Transcript_71419:2767-3693(+)